MSTKYLEEHEVTVDAICNIYKSAFMKIKETDKTDDNSLIVDFDSHGILVRLNKEEKLLSMMSSLGQIKLEDYDEDFVEKLTLMANVLNIEQSVVRFTVATTNDKIIFSGHYSISYEMGIIPGQVVNMTRLFGEIASKASRAVEETGK